jgi:hypothetical protein
MEKIKINRIDPKVHDFKGFNEPYGCFGCACNDACCRYGADFDKEAYDIVFKHKDLVENETGIMLEECFEKAWIPHKDYLGGKCIRSITSNGFCVFHSKKGKGCVLYELYIIKKLPRRIIPSICRLYPLTWNEQSLKMVRGIETTCNCLDKENVTKKNIIETQKDEIKDIFDIKL